MWLVLAKSFSFVVDTVLLPIDLLRSGSKGENDKPVEPDAAPKPSQDGVLQMRKVSLSSRG